MALSTFDVMNVLGVKRECLRAWMSEGFITPSKQAEGQGTKAEFSLLDLCNVAKFQMLIDMGYKRSVAARLSK